MSNLYLRQSEKHLEILNKRLAGTDVSVIAKELSSAKAYAGVVTDGRVLKTINKRIESLTERMSEGSQKDVALEKIRDNLKLLCGMMEKHGSYSPRTRKPRKKK